MSPGPYCVIWAYSREGDEEYLWVLGDVTVSRPTHVDELQWPLQEAVSTRYGQELLGGGYRVAAPVRPAGTPSLPWSAAAVYTRPCSQVPDPGAGEKRRFSLSP